MEKLRNSGSWQKNSLHRLSYLFAYFVTYSLALFFLLAQYFESRAAAQSTPVNAQEVQGAVYYDAEEVRINQSDGSIALSGKVLFLFGNSFVKCDVLRYYKSSGIVIAEGNVFIYRGKEQLQATRMVAHIASREFYSENVWLRVDPSAKQNEFNEKILGFTEAELEFETLRQKRQSDLISELVMIRENYTSLKNLSSVQRGLSENKETTLKIEETERRYAQILGRLARTRYQPNLFLDSLPASEQLKLEQRREIVTQFVKTNQQNSSKVASTLEEFPGYLAMTAATVHQRSDGKLVATGARLTPCKCDMEDIPIWGLSSADALIEPGKYATLYGATADIADIPALYVPYLKFPIKSERESGFLLPTVYLSRAGQIVSVPYFQTLGEHADATVTIDDFSSRGTRFGSELRGSLTKSAKATITGEYISDMKRVKGFDREAIQNEIDEEYKDNDFRKAQLKSQIGTVSSDRWKTTGALNAPYAAAVAGKADWTLVSDNQYLSDFSVAQESKTDLFAPAQSSYRFLAQELAAEYYGSWFGLSLRTQKFADVVESDFKKTPYRSPKIEFSLFPKRLLDTRISVEQVLSWEQIQRENPLNFIDLFEQQSVSGVPGGANSSGTSPVIITNIPDGKRTPNEPYIAGQRIFSQSRVAAPIAANRYVLSTAAIRGVSTAYLFDATGPYSRQVHRMSYVAYEWNNNSKITAERQFARTESDENLFLATNFTPYLNFNYVPEVNRDQQFPKFYDVFYEADNFAPERKAYFGFDANLEFGRTSFEEVSKPIARFKDQSLPDPARTENLARALRKSEITALPLESEEIFALSKDVSFSKVLIDWARIELESYQAAVVEKEFGEYLQWPQGPSFQKTRKTTATPLRYGLGTSYNIDSEFTRQDIQSRLKPGTFADRIDPWGDIVFLATLSGQPWIPITTSMTLSWSPWRKVFYTGSTSVNLSLPFNLNMGLTNTFETYDVQTGMTDADRKKYLKRTIGISATYAPTEWLLFTYQRKADTDSQIEALPEPELRYESLQKVSLVNLQDCLDIELTRYKKNAVVERNATWSIGLNLKFLGQAKSFSDIGASLNRSIQSRNSEF